MNATVRNNQLLMVAFKIVVSAIIISISFSANAFTGIDASDNQKDQTEKVIYNSNDVLSMEFEPCQSEVKIVKIYNSDMELVKHLEFMVYDENQYTELNRLLSQSDYLVSVENTFYYILNS